MYKHAWFSKLHEPWIGSWEVDTIDQRVVRATYMTDVYSATYIFHDKVYLGLVKYDSRRDFSMKSSFNPTSSVIPTPGINLCYKCGHEIKLRELFFSTYIGCWC